MAELNELRRKKRIWTERYSVLKESGSGSGGVLSSRGFVGVNNTVLYKIRFLQRRKAPFIEEDGSNLNQGSSVSCKVLER
jgi:hypothetical protein